MASRPTRDHLRLDFLRRRCESGKVSYVTRDDALEGAERGMDAGKVSPGCHLMPYECDRCGQWHVRNQQIVYVAPAEPSRRARSTFGPPKQHE